MGQILLTGNPHIRRYRRLTKISVVIITYNEAHNISRCVDSVAGIAEEILVVDSFSTDRTVEICKKKGVRIATHAFEGHIEQKNYAVSLAEYEHILSLDADEALSDELKASIHTVKLNWEYAGYWLTRLTNYCGKWIRHSGWYPDRKLRLWDRRRGGWGGVNPHDRVILDEDASTGQLSGDLFHYSYYSLRQHIAHVNSFSGIAAKASYNQGRKSHLVTDIVCNPFLTFMKKYILKLGILDGYYGFLIAVISGFGKFLKYAKLRELEQGAPGTYIE